MGEAMLAKSKIPRNSLSNGGSLRVKGHFSWLESRIGNSRVASRSNSWNEDELSRSITEWTEQSQQE